MIQWYDIVASIICAWFMMNFFFVPFIGPILAYGIYEGWVQGYCEYRKGM